MVYFDLKSDAIRSSIVKATLGLYVRRPRGEGPQNVTYMIIDKFLSNADDKKCRFKYKKINYSKRSSTGKFYLFEVTRMVQKWIDNPDSNFGLLVESNTLHDGKPMVVTNPGPNEAEYVSIHLVTITCLLHIYGLCSHYYVSVNVNWYVTVNLFVSDAIFAIRLAS